MEGDFHSPLFFSHLMNRLIRSKSWINRLEISMGSPTIEEIREDFLFFYGSVGRTDVLSHIYNPSKPPFDKGGLWQDFVLLEFLFLRCDRDIFLRYSLFVW